MYLLTPLCLQILVQYDEYMVLVAILRAQNHKSGEISTGQSAKFHHQPRLTMPYFINSIFTNKYLWLKILREQNIF